MRNVPTGHFTLHSCKIFFHRNVKTLGFRNYFHIEICQVLSIMVVVNQLQPSMMTKVINPVSKIVDREKIIVRGAVYRYFVWLSLYSFATSFPLFIVLIKWSNVNVPSQFLRNSTLIFFGISSDMKINHIISTYVTFYYTVTNITSEWQSNLSGDVSFSKLLGMDKHVQCQKSFIFHWKRGFTKSKILNLNIGDFMIPYKKWILLCDI